MVILHGEQYCAKEETMPHEHWLLIHVTPWSCTGKAVPPKLEIPGKGCSLCLWCSNNTLGRCFLEMQYGSALGNNGCDSAPAKILSNLWQEGTILEVWSWSTSGILGHHGCLSSSESKHLPALNTEPATLTERVCSLVPICASVIRKICHLDSATSKPGTEEILAYCLLVCWVPSADSGKNEKRKSPFFLCNKKMFQ